MTVKQRPTVDMLARKLASHCWAGGTNLASRAVSSGEDRCGGVKDDSPSQPMLEAALNILPNTVYGGGISFLIIQGLALDICWEDACLRSLIDPSLPFIHDPFRRMPCCEWDDGLLRLHAMVSRFLRALIGSGYRDLIRSRWGVGWSIGQQKHFYMTSDE
jgi:hypothetical protein